MTMYMSIREILVLVVLIITTSTTQVTNIAGSASVSVSPIDATCGRTSADSYCRVDLAADDGCVADICRTACANIGQTYRDLLLGVSGFNYDGSVTNATKGFDGSDVVVATFKGTTRLSFLKGSLNMTAVEPFTLTFWIRPAIMEKESSVIDIHGAAYGERVFNVRLDADLGVTVVSGTSKVTSHAWRLPRHAWSHVAVQFRQDRVNVFLNGSHVSDTLTRLHIHGAADMSRLNLKIGQSFAGDLSETHPVDEKLPVELDFCRGRSDGWVNHDIDKVRVYCLDGAVSSTQDSRWAFSCDIVSIAGSPSSDADFCRDKDDGWYRLQNYGYSRCVGGRQLDLHYCGGRHMYAWRSGPRFKQCSFCSKSCSCEIDCPGSAAKERCDALSFVCRDGEQKVHPKYCDQYYFCEKGIYVKMQCAYPDRWSLDHSQCESFLSVSCGERIPKNHPCDREETRAIGPGGPMCNLEKHPANCTHQQDGLYFAWIDEKVCAVYGCVNETLAMLEGDVITLFPSSNQRATYFMCPWGRGIDPATGLCMDGGHCSTGAVGYIPDSPYLRCRNDEVSTYRYDCRRYWHCEDGLWIVNSCAEGLMWSDGEKQCVSDVVQCGDRSIPETVDTHARQFLGALADIRLYDVALSDRDIQDLNGVNCTTWGRYAHPIEYVADSYSTTYWLSRPNLDSVDLLFKFGAIFKLEEIALTFFGPVPLVVSIFKKVTTDDPWQLWRVFRDDCSDVSRCSQLGATKQDGDRLIFNLLDAYLGPLQRRTLKLRILLSGHRVETATTKLTKLSYYGLYNVVINHREFSLCGSYKYLEQESSRTCLPCDCEVQGVTDANVECNEGGGQCACKRYVTGRRCDQCLSGYENIRENNPDGCSKAAEYQTTSQYDNQEGSLKSWSLYTAISCVVVIIIIVVSIIVVCVRSRRHQRRDSDNERETPATEIQPAYERPTPVFLSDAGPDYTLMTRPGSDKVQRRLAGQTHTIQATGETDYMEPPTAVLNNPDYQRPVPAVPITTAATYTQLTIGEGNSNTKRRPSFL